MARLSTPEAGRLYVTRALEDYDPRAKERNGEYRGPLTVRTVPFGLSGKALEPAREHPERGQVWRRGTQLVRVLGVETGGKWVRFQELTHGKAVRRQPLRQFLAKATKQGDS